MVQVFGEVIEEYPGEEEYLVFRFSSNVTLRQRWQNNVLSADFIANFLQSSIAGKTDGKKLSLSVKTKNAIKYVANELLENVVKFHDGSSGYPNRMGFGLHGNTMMFYASNSITAKTKDVFQAYIQKLLDNDPYELYMQQMEANAMADASGSARLGCLSIICDYSAKLGWKFDTVPHGRKQVIEVMTMVKMDI